MKKSLLLNYSEKDDLISIKVNYVLFEKQYDKDILTNIEKNSLCKFQIMLMEKCMKYIPITIIKKNDIYEELINQT